MGIRVAYEQATGHGQIYLQEGKIRVDEHVAGTPRIDTCRCCVCRAARVEIPDGQRTFCVIKAEPNIGMPSGVFSGFHNTYATGDNVLSVSMWSGTTPPGHMCGGGGPWMLGFRSGSGGGSSGVPVENSMNIPTGAHLTPVEGYDTAHSCEWSDWGSSTSTNITVIDPLGVDPCSDQNPDQTVTAMLSVQYVNGYWVADGFLWTAGVQYWTGLLGAHGETHVSNSGVPFRWFHGYLAHDSHLELGQHIDIPNLQTVTPHDSCQPMESRYGFICVSEGGYLRISPGVTTVLPCQPPGEGIAKPDYPDSGPTQICLLAGNVYATNMGCVNGTYMIGLYFTAPFTTPIPTLPAGFIRIKDTNNVWYYNVAGPTNCYALNTTVGGHSVGVIVTAFKAGAGEGSCAFHKFTAVVTRPMQILFSPAGLLPPICVYNGTFEYNY